MAIIRLLIAACCTLVVIHGCEIWDYWPLKQSTSGTHTSAGDASVAACMMSCNDTSTCVAFDYHNNSAVTDKCFTFTQIRQLVNADAADQYRPLSDFCPAEAYYELQTCTIYRYLGYKGLPDLAYSSTTQATLNACRDKCILDNANCGGYTYYAGTMECQLYSDKYAIVLCPATDAIMYILKDCPPRDLEKMGFFLYHSYLKSNSGTSATVATLPLCWKSCWDDFNCYGFDYNPSTTTCVTNTESQVNDTAYVTGFYHHTLLTAASFTGTAPSVPTGLPTSADMALCKVYTEYQNMRSMWTNTIAHAGNADMETCLDMCEKDSSCNAIDWFATKKPKKGVKCWTYATAPTGRFGVNKVHQIHKTSTACPAIASTVSNSGCTWNQFDTYKGVIMTGITSTETTLGGCMTACAAVYDCWAVDFDTSNVCTFYNYATAYWMTTSSTHTHYVRTACS